MIYLKEINYEDIDKEYEAFKKIPLDENGYKNKYYNITKEELKDNVIPELIKHSKGIDLESWRVPSTYFFLWDDDVIVGLFKIRHYLNEGLINGAGHIGYGIIKEYRGKGYATAGLKLAIDICKNLIKEDEIYLSSNKNNPASLKVQIKCGAYLASENEEQFFTRIKLNNDKNLHFGIRDLNRDDWSRLTDKKVIIDNIETEHFIGKVCYIKMLAVKSPLDVTSPIGKLRIADNNYQNLIIAPRDKNWWLTIMFDDKDELIESYFDITRLNNFYNEENPFFIDMKLDICMSKGEDASIMDKDELEEVYNAGMITDEIYKEAYDTADKIVNYLNKNKEYYYEKVYELFNRFKTGLGDVH